ncbi:acetyltransferase, GNAT family [Burkholderia cenocepacia BC7]|nr:acetyltransferase, GNAT family [Burkholderia cenocepacia BC7]
MVALLRRLRTGVRAGRGASRQAGRVRAFLRHRSTTHVGPSCYLQDLSTLDSEHGKGVGRALIEAVYDAARRHRAEYVHWLADARDGSHSAARPTTPARHERQDLQKDASALSTVDRVFNSLSFNASTTRHVHPDRRGDMAPNPG